MPELPEVELTRRRMERELAGKVIQRVEIRAVKLRLPIPVELKNLLPGQSIRSVDRRGKYLIFTCSGGGLIIHLGMTGYLRLHPAATPPDKHDHFELRFQDSTLLRFHDPRKFGTVAWTTDNPLNHPLLSRIGPEPLTNAFDGSCLFASSRSRRVAIKQLIMDAGTVAGVGNIYANEALFRARIRPDRLAAALTEQECRQLTLTIKEVLQESIDQGSTYRVAEDSVSYHPLEFRVYGRGKGACTVCGEALEEIRLNNRSTVFCPRCQV